MVLEAVQLDAVLIIDVDRLLLGHCEHVVVLQEARVSNAFLGREFADRRLLLPVHHRQVPLPSCQQQELPVATVSRFVRAMLQLQIENMLG